METSPLPEIQLDHDTLEQMDAQEILRLCIERSGMYCMDIAALCTEMLQIDGSDLKIPANFLTSIKNRGRFPMLRIGEETTGGEDPRYQVLAEFFFPKDKEAQEIFLRKIKEKQQADKAALKAEQDRNRLRNTSPNSGIQRKIRKALSQCLGDQVDMSILDTTTEIRIVIKMPESV